MTVMVTQMPLTALCCNHNTTHPYTCACSPTYCAHMHVACAGDVPRAGQSAASAGSLTFCSSSILTHNLSFPGSILKLCRDEARWRREAREGRGGHPEVTVRLRGRLAQYLERYGLRNLVQGVAHPSESFLRMARVLIRHMMLSSSV